MTGVGQARVPLGMAEPCVDIEPVIDKEHGSAMPCSDTPKRVYQKDVYADIVGTHGSCVRRLTIDYQLITNMVFPDARAGRPYCLAF